MHRRTFIVIAPVPLLLAACASDSARAPSTPATATPGVLAMTVSDFVDTDANHYRDTTRTTVYIYANSSQYPIPMRITGKFEFILEDARGNRLYRWNFDEAQTAAAARMLAPGPGYIFDLSLLGADRIEATEGEIIASFTPKGGKPIYTRTNARVAVGGITSRRGS
jgi:hypothetical protein